MAILKKKTNYSKFSILHLYLSAILQRDIPDTCNLSCNMEYRKKVIL